MADEEFNSKIVGWCLAACVFGLFVLMLKSSFGTPEQQRARSEAIAKEARDRCTAAVMSNIGTRMPMSYTDKVAYDKYVAENCQGFHLDSKP